MKKTLLSISLLALLTPFAWGQKYSMTFVCLGAKQNDSVLYIGQHYRDGFITLDSAKVDKDNTYTFSGRRKWSTGIYALYGKEAKKRSSLYTSPRPTRWLTPRRTSSGRPPTKPCTPISTRRTGHVNRQEI